MTHETIAHVTFYLDNQPAYTTTYTGPHLLAQASAELVGIERHVGMRRSSAGFSRGPGKPHFTRIFGELGSAAHVTFLRFGKGV